MSGEDPDSDSALLLASAAGMSNQIKRHKAKRKAKAVAPEHKTILLMIIQRGLIPVLKLAENDLQSAKQDPTNHLTVVIIKRKLYFAAKDHERYTSLKQASSPRSSSVFS